MVYDPYTTEHEVITFPGITHTQPYHLSGIDYDASSGAMFFSAPSGSAFETNGGDLSGPQKIIKWDPKAKKVIYIADLAPFQEEYQRTFGHAVAGFQDMAEDRHGNSYTPAAFGGYSIAKVAPDGVVTTFYMSKEAAVNATAQPFLYTGILSLPAQNKLLLSDSQRGDFVTFDTTSPSPVPKRVPISNMPSNYTSAFCDAIIAPHRYGQQVVLCAEDFLGGSGAITVFSSKDHWRHAKYLGVIFNSDPRTKGFSTTTAVEITNSIYLSSLPFGDTATGLDRSIFPYIDITKEVDALVEADRCSNGRTRA